MIAATPTADYLRVPDQSFPAFRQTLRLIGAAVIAAGLFVTSPATVWAGQIGDYVWNDADGDGMQEEGETGLSGVTVNLQDCSGTQLSATHTDEVGKYLFSGLAAGSYRIHFVAPAGWHFSLPKQTAGRQDSNPDPETGLTVCRPLADGQSRRGIDAGLNGPSEPPAGSGKIGDYVWDDADGDGMQEAGETGLSGVTVNLRDCNGTQLRTTQTDEVGQYLFSDLAAGSYQVQFATPAGWHFSLPKQTAGRQDSNPDPETGLTACRPLADGQSRRGIDAGLNANDDPGISGRPNILFILADDMGAETSNLYPSLAGDNGQLSSPNLEALAAAGIVFENAWANPVCSPTRGTLISGEYGHNTNVTRGRHVLDPNTTTSIFEYITSASPESYAMAVFGKWHLGDNVAAHGIPVFKGFVDGGITDYFNWTYEDENGNSTNTTTYSTTALTDFAIEFIQDQQQNNPSQPWFVYLPYNAPHATIGSNHGFQVPPADLHSVDVGTLQPGDIADNISVYQATIQAMDTEIGRLLGAIGPVGSPQRDNTIVIFMGDNGTPAAVKDTNTGVRGAKSDVQEGGVKVPLILSGAGVTRTNAREDAVVVSTDIYATIAELSGIAVSQFRDGFSIVPLLSDANATSGREYGFTELCTNRARYTVRDDQYKLTYDNGTWELFDLINDPLEANNLYNNPSYANEQSILDAELTSLQQSAQGGCFQ